MKTKQRKKGTQKTSSKKEEKKLTMLEIFQDPYYRKVYCRENLFAFGCYYFAGMMSHKSPDWHKDELCKNLSFKDFLHLLEIGHRDSAKTSWSKIKIIHAICYGYKKFIPIVGAEKTKAEKHCFDIARQLQTNVLLIKDFGQLYFDEEDANRLKQSKKKSIGHFITTNDILVQAFSTDTPLRGEQFIDKNQKPNRPDLVYLDDIETDKTKFSIAMTNKIKRFVDDLIDIGDVDLNIIVSANRISNKGVVSHIEAMAQNSSNWRVMDKKLIENGQITWPSKFVWTDAEARLINAMVREAKFKVKSIETLKSRGTRKFNQEYLNIPITEEDEFIKLEWVNNGFYTQEPNLEKCKIFIALDPQSGETKKADEFAITVLAVNGVHKYVIKQICGRKSNLEQAGLFVKEVQDYGILVRHASVEVIMSQTAVYQLIRDWQAGFIELPHCNNANRNISVSKYETKVKKKDRLLLQEDKFERGEIHIRPEMTNLLEQVVYFHEKMEHDDRVDSLLQALEISNMYCDENSDIITSQDYENETRNVAVMTRLSSRSVEENSNSNILD